jgi:imidazoleglycerol phosphate synthase glutamine amidotransferase subunit HisH
VIASAEKVVLPGVGAFGPTVDFLNAKGLFAPLKERIANNKHTVCICLGFQLLAETSEEVRAAPLLFMSVSLLPSPVLHPSTFCKGPVYV